MAWVGGVVREEFKDIEWSCGLVIYVCPEVGSEVREILVEVEGMEQGCGSAVHLRIKLDNSLFALL